MTNPPESVIGSGIGSVDSGDFGGAPVFVTGGTGFIGARLISALVCQGRQVRALTRGEDAGPPEYLSEKEKQRWTRQVQWAAGELRDQDSLLRAMEGCAQAYHLASFARTWSRDKSVFFDVNVLGARNVLDAAQKQGLTRVVATTSLLTLGPRGLDDIGDENSQWDSSFFTDYQKTKAIAEKETLARSSEKLETVVVSPGRVFGPGRLTEGNSLTRAIDQYDRGKLPILPNRGVNVCNYVFVEDVVKGHILAMEKGGAGECYILGGENLSIKAFFQLISHVTDKRHFQLPLFHLAPLAFAWLLEKRADWFGAYPSITTGWMKTLLSDWTYRSDKAERELGYTITPIEEALRITCAWLAEQRKEGR